MFCSNCGSKLADGALFCSECGQPQGVQAPPAQPMGAAAAMPPKKPRNPLSKGTKIAIGVCAGVLVLAAVALVLVFVVFADKIGVGGGGSLFKSGTPQTQFANDCVAVVTGALGEIGGDTMDRIGKEPFDIEINFEATRDGEEMESGTLAAAYDKLSLGILTPDEVRVLLTEDTLVIEDWGATIYRIDSEEDLDRAMPLSDRLSAVGQSLAAQTDIDLLDVLEKLLNSIEADCISSRGSSKILRMDLEDVMQMLENFEEATADDDDLNDAIAELTGGMDVGDIVGLADMFLGMMLGDEFEIEIEVGYTGSEPTSLAVKMDGGESGGFSFEAALSYESRGSDSKIAFDMETASGYQNISARLDIERKRDGAEFGGTVKVGDDEEYTIDGSEEWDGEDVSGSIEIEMNQGGYRETIEVEYDEVLRFGMPDKAVADDRRFEIDTKDADKRDFSDLFGIGLHMPDIDMPGLSSIEPLPDMAVAAATQAPEPLVTEEPVERAALETLGVIFDGDASLEVSIMDAIDDYAADAGVEVITVLNDYDAGAEMQNVQNLIAQGVDALVIYSWHGQEDVITQMAEEASVAAVFIDSEDIPGHQTVRLNYYDIGVAVGRSCETDNVYVLTPNPDHWLSQELEAGMNESLLDIIGTDVTYFDSSNAADLAKTAIGGGSVDTVICLDPVSAPMVLEALESAGFEGSLICVAEEVLMADMHPQNVDTLCVYYPVDMIAQALFWKAQAVLAEGSGYTDVYTVAPATAMP